MDGGTSLSFYFCTTIKKVIICITISKIFAVLHPNPKHNNL